MKKNKVKIIGAIAIVLVLIGGIALSYAFFSTSDKQKTANTFRSGCLNITIESESSAITLNNAYPISDVEGLGSKGYTFTIKNTCNKDTNYMINLESLNETSNTLDSNYLKVALESDTMDNLISKLGSNPTTDPMITGAYESHNLYNGTIIANETKEFTLREWIDYNVTKEIGMNKTVTNKINVIARPDLEVEDLAEIKTTYNDLKLTANVVGGGILKEENKIASTTNDPTYPFSYNEETKKYTSTNKDNETTSSITFKVEKEGDAKICYQVSSEENYDEVIFYVGDEQVETASGEKTECMILENVGPDKDIKIEYSKDKYEYSGNDEVSFSIELLPVYQLPIKYCISDKNICEPNKDTNVINDKITIDLNPKEQLVCIKLNNEKIYCNKKDKLPPILANDFLKGNEIKPKFESITTLNKINIPSDAIKSWDASEANNKSVMAYYTDVDNNGKYELYLAGDDKIMAPEDSTMLFGGNSYVYVPDDKVSHLNRFSAVIEVDLSNLDTSNVINMSEMFRGMTKLTDLDVSKFDTSQVTNMSNMFRDMNSLTDLDVSNFNTRNVINMGGMFLSLNNVTYLDVSNFDTSQVTNMTNMFYEMSSLTSLDVSNFDTSKVTSTYGMFNGVNKVTSLDVSNFDTSKVTSMSYMFNGMKSLSNIDVSHFDTSNVIYMGSMFQDMTSLTSLDVSNFDTSNVIDMSYMFDGVSKVTSIDVSHFDTSKVTNMNSMFAGMWNITTLDLNNFNTSNVTNMTWMFYGVSKVTSLDLNNFDTSKVTDMHDMFCGMRSLTSLDVSNFDTKNVTDMSGMFEFVENLTDLNLSHFNTSNVKDMNGMFGYMSSLTTLDLSNFDTSNVTDMDSMFNSMSSLTSLNLSKADFSKVTSYRRMFNSISSLNTIKVKDATAKTFIESRITDARLTDASIPDVTVTPVS